MCARPLPTSRCFTGIFAVPRLVPASPGLPCMFAGCSPCVLSRSAMFDSLRPRGLETRQFPLSMGFSRQEYWSGLLFPPPGDLPDPEIQPTSLMSLALAGGFFTTTWEGPLCTYLYLNSLSFDKDTLFENLPSWLQFNSVTSIRNPLSKYRHLLWSWRPGPQHLAGVGMIQFS